MHVQWEIKIKTIRAESIWETCSITSIGDRFKGDMRGRACRELLKLGMLLARARYCISTERFPARWESEFKVETRRPLDAMKPSSRLGLRRRRRASVPYIWLERKTCIGTVQRRLRACSGFATFGQVVSLVWSPRGP